MLYRVGMLPGTLRGSGRRVPIFCNTFQTFSIRYFVTFIYLVIKDTLFRYVLKPLQKTYAI